jgi:micrococcal nuclease
VHILLLSLCLLCACHSKPLDDYVFVEALDGDTVLVSDRFGLINKVRLLGIDTPEYSQDPWGQRAQKFIYSRLKPGQELHLEYGRERKDRYGRLLAYVFYSKAGQRFLLNEQILRNGWGEIFIFDRNDSHNQYLKDALAYAKANRLNIWQDNGLSLSPYKYRKLHKKHLQ